MGSGFVPFVIFVVLTHSRRLASLATTLRVSGRVVV